MDYITVEVVVIGGGTKQVNLDGGRTVADALRAAEVSSEGREVKRNGETASPETVLSNGDKVLVLKPIRGN